MSVKILINPQENIVEAIKVIGQTIIDRAEETGRDIEDVSKITIHSEINPSEVTQVEITKSYNAMFKKVWCKGKIMRKQ